MNEHLYGVIPPMTTPFRADESIDEELFRADVRHMVERAGVHGLAVAGSTGEGHTLNTDETVTVAGAAVEASGKRVPVICGIIVDSTRDAIEKGKAVAGLGVAALQVTPVHYLFRPDDDAMLRHFDRIVQATGMPVIIYNVVPWTYLSPALLGRIFKQVEGVIGVKQSAGDLKLLADLLLAEGQNARIFTAVDALLYSSFSLGAHGVIAAMPTAVPELAVALWDAVKGGDHAAALSLHERMLRVWNAMDGANLPAAVKSCMELQGRRAGLPRGPMPPVTEAKADEIRSALQAAGVQVV